MAGRITYLTVKAVKRDGGRWIEGYATTPSQDRVGDVVLPEGAQFSLPLPLLFAHKHDEPIGSVVEAFVTRAGIRIRAKLTEGVARAEEVWRLIEDGALTAVSIGFQALKSTPLATGGLRFDSWSWHELSVVSVPANPDARIVIGKSLCYGQELLPPAKPARKHPASVLPGPEMVGQVIGTALREALGPVQKRIAALEAASDGRGLKFMGRYVRGLEYRMGEVVQFGPSLWVAKDTTTNPPAASDDWRRMLTTDNRGGFTLGETE